MSISNYISRLSNEKKTAIAFVLASALNSGLNMLTTPFFTRVMPVEDFGIVSLYSTWYQIICVIATFSVTNAVLNVGYYRYQEERFNFSVASLVVCLGTALLSGFVIMLFSNWIIPFSGLKPSLFLLIILCCIFLTSTQVWINRERYEFRYKGVLVITIITSTISTGLSILFVLNATDNFADAKLWSSYIPQLVVGFGFYLFFFSKGLKGVKWEYIRFILCFNAPLLLHYLSQFILESSDRIMINHYYGEASVAVYSLAYSISGILLVLYTPIHSVIIPICHRLVKEGNNKEITNLYFKVIVLSGLTLITISLLSPEIVSILGGKNYRDGMFVVPVVTSSTLFIILYLLISNIEFLYGKTQRIAIMTIAAAVMNIILNILLMPIWGYKVAAYTTLITYIVYSYLHMYNMINMHKVNLFVCHKFMPLIFGATAICLSTQFIFDYNVIRYIVIILLLSVATCFVFKKKILINTK